jgi:colicin import membrane protein
LSSEYEYIVSKNLTERLHKLHDLQNAYNSSKYEKDFARMEIETLESLFENFNLGLSFFRRQGTKSTLKELYTKEENK